MANRGARAGGRGSSAWPTRRYQVPEPERGPGEEHRGRAVGEVRWEKGAGRTEPEEEARGRRLGPGRASGLVPSQQGIDLFQRLIGGEMVEAFFGVVIVRRFGILRCMAVPW